MLSDVVAAAREAVRIKVRGRRLRDASLPDARVVRNTPDQLELAVHPHAVRRVLATVTELRDVQDVHTDVPSASCSGVVDVAFRALISRLPRPMQRLDGRAENHCMV